MATSEELLLTQLGQGGTRFDSGTTGVDGRWKLMQVIAQAVIADSNIANMQPVNGLNGATIAAGVPGIFHGMRSLVLSDDDGQIFPAHSISAGLDYPGIGPEHANLRDMGRAEYVVATDEEALEAFQVLSRSEGIIPALESSHAIAHVQKLAPTLPKDALIVVNLSGRGDKDVDEVRMILEARKQEAH